MMTNNTFPVQLKLVNYKIISLKYYQNHTTRNPLFYKKLSRTDKPPFPVYDYITSTSLNQLNEPLPNTHKNVTTSKGGVDGYFIYPPTFFQPSADPGINNDETRLEIEVMNPPEVLLDVTEFYNGFEDPENQWYGSRADENTKQMILNVDFSSLVTNNNQFNQLFQKFPIGEITEISADGKVTDKDFYNISHTDGIFSIKAENVQKKSVIKIKWKFNWDFIYENNSKFIDVKPNENLDSGNDLSPNEGANVIYNIGTMSGSIQHGTKDSLQNTIINNHKKELSKILEELKEIQQGVSLSTEQKEELKDEIMTLEIQKESKKPKNERIKESLNSIHKIINGIAPFTPVIAKIGQFLTLL